MNSSLHDRAGQLVDLVVVEKVEKRVFYATSGELPAFYSGVVELQANAFFVSLSWRAETADILEFAVEGLR
jgi:hypothetical protein